jgi:ABC-type taurine transport system ATPase subunit
MASELDVSTTFIPALYKPAALLPIARHKESLLYLVEKYPVTIVVGQTGSGKTTQLPQYLDQAGWCKDGKVIAVTQVSSKPVLFTSLFNMLTMLIIALSLDESLQRPSQLVLLRKCEARSVKQLDTQSASKIPPQNQRGSNSSLMECF